MSIQNMPKANGYLEVCVPLDVDNGGVGEGDGGGPRLPGLSNSSSVQREENNYD